MLIGIEAEFIAPLLGHTIRMQINDRSFDYLVPAGFWHEFEVHRQAAQSRNRLICIRFELPLTLTSTWNFRGLGMRVGGLQFRYVKAVQQPAISSLPSRHAEPLSRQ